MGESASAGLVAIGASITGITTLDELKSKRTLCFDEVTNKQSLKSLKQSLGKPNK